MTSKVWEEMHNTRKYGENLILFKDIFEDYLKKTSNKLCLEIGCYPGYYLAYITKKFGYGAAGIDYVANTEKIVGKTLQANKIKKYLIYNENFLYWKSPKKYDLVCSFGFIEHFSGSTSKKVFKKHIDLMKSNGKLIIDVPNPYYLYNLRLLFNKLYRQEHYIKIMKLNYFKKMAKKYKLKVLHLNYYSGFYLIDAILNRLGINPNKFQWFRKLNNIFISQFIIFVAEKSGVAVNV